MPLEWNLAGDLRDMALAKVAPAGARLRCPEVSWG